MEIKDIVITILCFLVLAEIILFLLIYFNVINLNKSSSTSNYTDSTSNYTDSTSPGCCGNPGDNIYDPPKPVPCCDGSNPVVDNKGTMRCKSSTPVNCCGNPGDDVYNPSFKGCNKPVPCCDGSTPVVDSKGTMRCKSSTPVNCCGNPGDDVYNPSFKGCNKPVPCCDGSTPVVDSKGVVRCKSSTPVPPPSNKGRIIVLRHAEDEPDDSKKWGPGGVVVLPNKQTVKYQSTRLTPKGLDQSNELIDYLNTTVIGNNILPVTKVFVKNPDGSPPSGYVQTTSNPFLTINPFIQQNKITDVSLLYNYTDINFETLNTDNGSILICWDKEGLWGDEYSTITNGTIIDSLNKKYNINITKSPFPSIINPIYLYTTNNLQLYNPNFTK